MITVRYTSLLGLSSLVPTKSTPNTLLAFVGTEDTATTGLSLKLTAMGRA